MRLYGLTGGIASGKSSVSRMFQELGCSVLDADSIYHALITPVAGEPSPLAQAIEQRFPGVVRPDGQLDRTVLAERVFGPDNNDDRDALNNIAHPTVAKEAERRIQQLAGQGVELALYDIPLLYERGREKDFADVIVVWVPRDLQIERLIQRDGFSPAEAEKRVDSQLPLEEKRQRARWVVDNTGDLDGSRKQVDTIWQALQGDTTSAK